MARYSGTAKDENKVPLPGTLILVQESTTGVLAALTDDSGYPLSNPIVADALGGFVFNTEDNYYDLVYTYRGRILLIDRSVAVGTTTIPAGSIINALGDNPSIAPSQAIVTAAFGLLGVYPTMAGAASLILLPTLKHIIVGARTDASERVPMDFQRVASQPPHLASFRSQDRFLPDGTISSTNGGWWELCSPRVTPEMLADRVCGYRVGFDGYASAPDDTAILQAAITASIHLDLPLELHGKWYRHNSHLLAEPTRQTPYEGTSTDPLNLNFWSVINAQSFMVKAFGNAGLIAGGAMDYQIRVYNDFTLANSREPQWCRFEGVKLNGNSLVTSANLFLNWSGNAHIEDCGMTNAPRSAQVFGFGVFLIQHNDLNGSLTTIDIQAGGDATIRDNDIFAENVAINASGNVKIHDNIFTATGFKSGDLPRIGVTVNPLGTTTAGIFPYSYGMRITGNEFNSFDLGVSGDATSSNFDAIHMLTIADNHMVGDINANPDMTLCNLTEARNVSIYGNQINRDVQSVSQAPAVILTNCETSHVADNDFSNIANSAIVLTGCTSISVHDNTLTNVSCISNAIAWSEALQTSPWATTNASVITGTTSVVPVNTLLVPNGATLQRLQDNSTNGVHGASQPRTVLSGQAYTASALVVAAELTKGKICPHDSAVGAAFDLVAGAIVADAGCSAGINALGGGIFRVWCAINSMPNTSANPGVYLANAAGSLSYAGTGQGMFVGAAGLIVGFAPPSYDGATGASGSTQPAQVVLTNSDHCDVHDNTVMAKYAQPLATVFCAEGGTSNFNTVKDNVMPDAGLINPFFKIGSNSYVSGWEKSACRVTMSAAQVVPSAVSTQLVFDQTPLNRGVKYSTATNRYTPGPGNVKLSAGVKASGLIVGGLLEVFIFKNGAAIGGISRLATATTDAVNISVEDECGQTDYYQVNFYSDGAGSKTISNDARATYFSGTLS